MNKKIQKSAKRKIVKAGGDVTLGDVNLDEGGYNLVAMRMGGGKKPRVILDFETSGGEGFSVQLERKNMAKTIQKAHRQLKLKWALRMKDLGFIEKK